MDSQTQLKVDILAKAFAGKIKVAHAQKLLGQSRELLSDMFNSMVRGPHFPLLSSTPP